MRGPGDKKYTVLYIRKPERLDISILVLRDTNNLKILHHWAYILVRTMVLKKDVITISVDILVVLKIRKKALAKEIRKSKGLYNAKILSHKYLW